MLAAALAIVAGSEAEAQYRAPGDYRHSSTRARYSLAQRERIAREIAARSQARSRGEEVGQYAPPKPAHEYADVYDSRYLESDEPSPPADDRSPAPGIDFAEEQAAADAEALPPRGMPLFAFRRGGEDRPEAPDYLNHGGRDAALANGYRTRGVQEFSDSRGQGVRLDDLYPLDPSVNPRAYRGHYDYRTYDDGRSQAEDDRDTEAFIRRELLVRPGANLRVSSTGTYTFRNYIEHGAQVRDRFRLPVHQRYQYLQQQ